MENQPNNPLHGVKLADILSELVDNYGWEHMAFKVKNYIYISYFR